MTDKEIVDALADYLEGHNITINRADKDGVRLAMQELEARIVDMATMEALVALKVKRQAEGLET